MLSCKIQLLPYGCAALGNPPSFLWEPRSGGQEKQGAGSYGGDAAQRYKKRPLSAEQIKAVFSYAAKSAKQATNPNPSPMGNKFGFARFGGGEGSRTPVRKPFHGSFSGRRRSSGFPSRRAHRQTQRIGSFMMRGTLKALRTHGRHSSTPRSGSWPFRTGRQPN